MKLIPDFQHMSGLVQHSRIHEAKQVVIDTSLLVAALMGIISFIITEVSRLVNHRFSNSIYTETLTLAVLLLVTLYRRRLSNEIKALMIIGLLIFFSLSDAVVFGVFSSARIYLVLVPFFSILYLSLRHTLYILAASLAGFFIIGYLHHVKILSIPADFSPEGHLLRFYTWVSIATDMAFVGVVLLFITRSFLKNFTALVNDLESNTQIIRKQEQRYREMNELLPLTVFESDLSGRLTFINHTGKTLFGIKEQILAEGITIFSYIRQEDQQRAMMSMNLTMQGKGVESNHYVLRKEDGNHFPAQIFSKPIHNEGQLLGLQGVIVDVSNQEESAKAIKESENRFRALMESLNELIIVTDNYHVVQYINKRFTEVLGYQPEEMVGKVGFAILHDPVDFAKVEEANLERLAGKESSYELAFKAKDGRRLFFLVSGAPYRNSLGEIIGSIGALLDISERKKAEDALRESEQKYRILFENAQIGIYQTTPDGRILNANPAILRMTGFDTLEQLQQVSLASGDLHGNNARKQFIDTIEKNGRVVNFESEWKNRNGNIIHIIENASAVKGPDGKTRYYDGFVEDVTQRRVIEAELEEHHTSLEMLVQERTDELAAANEELHMSNEELLTQRGALEDAMRHLQEAQEQLLHSEKMASLGILAAGIAHEINNPLNFIQTGISLLDNYFTENLQSHKEEVAPLINGVQEGVTRAAAIVTSLNHYSRRDEQKMADCSLQAIIENCLVMLQNQIKNRIIIKRKFGSATIHVQGNESKLHQAMLNILANAAQAIEGEGTITISTALSNNKVVTLVEDTGIGISQEDLARIFDPFFTTKAPGKGTGLGLAITYKIIQEHHGKIRYESEPGRGTRVTIELPFGVEDK